MAAKIHNATNRYLVLLNLKVKCYLLLLSSYYYFIILTRQPWLCNLVAQRKITTNKTQLLLKWHYLHYSLPLSRGSQCALTYLDSDDKKLLKEVNHGIFQDPPIQDHASQQTAVSTCLSHYHTHDRHKHTTHWGKKCNWIWEEHCQAVAAASNSSE